MNLTIDVGNTYIKIGVFKNAVIVYKQVVKPEDFSKQIRELQKKYPEIKKVMLSSVSLIKKEDVAFLQRSYTTLILDHALRFPFKNLYATPKTLGVDRIALVAAAVDQFPKKNCLILDAGTCITYDFKNDNEEYLGGAIAPGIRLRYKSLNDYTANLPLLESKDPENYIGDSTEESMHSGVINGILREIDGIIDQYCNTYNDLTVILTGGDAHFLSNRLKNSIFATSNFLLEGLNHILDFNSSQ